MSNNSTVRRELEVMTNGVLSRQEVADHRSNPGDDRIRTFDVADRPPLQLALVAVGRLPLRRTTHEEIEPILGSAEGTPAHDTSRHEVDRLVPSLLDDLASARRERRLAPLQLATDPVPEAFPRRLLAPQQQDLIRPTEQAERPSQPHGPRRYRATCISIVPPL